MLSYNGKPTLLPSEQEIPQQKKERQKLHKLLDNKLLEDPEFQELHSQFKTKIALAIELIEQGQLATDVFSRLFMNQNKEVPV